MHPPPVVMPRRVHRNGFYRDPFRIRIKFRHLRFIKNSCRQR